ARAGGAESACFEAPVFTVALGPDYSRLSLGGRNTGHKDIRWLFSDGDALAPALSGELAQEDLIVLALVALPGEPQGIAVSGERGVVILKVVAGNLHDQRGAVDFDGGAEREDPFGLGNIHGTERKLALGDLNGQQRVGGRKKIDGDADGFDHGRLRLG